MKTHARPFANLGISAIAVCFAVVTAIAQSPAPPVKGSADHTGRNQGDGIKVHGYWTIDVRNADGSLASHNEFVNALQPSGATALSALLGRSNTVGSWQLDLMGADPGGPCVTTPAVVTPARSKIFIGRDPIFYDAQTDTLFGAPDMNLSSEPHFQNVFTGIQQLTTPGNTVNIPLVAFNPGGAMFTIASNGTVPGLSHDWDGAQSFTLHYTQLSSEPASYDSYITLATAGGPSHVYHVRVVIADDEPATPAPTPAPCTAVEPGTTIPSDFSTAWFPTLALNVIQGPAGTASLELTGNVTAASAVSIEQVRSVIVLSPSGARTPFSARTLATPIQVAIGQQIYVKVVLSFS